MSREHIYRQHQLILCTRCGETFKRQDDLTAHSRLSQGCELKNYDIPDPSEGFDKAKEALLKKKRKLPNLTEEQKWKDMFMILFPEDAESTIPSPCWFHLNPLWHCSNTLKLTHLHRL